MLICQVVSGLMYGGGQRVALDIASGLHQRNGMQTRMVLLGDRIDAGWPRIDHPLSRIAGYDGRYNRPGTLAQSAFALRCFLRDHRIDIVHSHGWDADVITGWAVRGSRTPHIVHQHILADWAASRRLQHLARRLITMSALRRRRTYWVAVSNAVKESLRSLPWLRTGEVSVVWNGVDVEKFHSDGARRETERPVIGVVARLAPMKGLHYLIKAISELSSRGVACDLWIAGEGPLRTELQQLTETHNLSQQVTFLGHLDDPTSFYNSVDVFALPSVALEGLPLSILEAMACGLPVVSTTVSGIPEVVLHGASGSLVRPADVGALARALEPLLHSAALRARMGAEGRRRIESMFSQQRFLAEMSALYAEAVAA